MALFGRGMQLGRRAASGPVTLFSDDFNRADSATLGANWTPDTTEWAILSNFARLSGTGTARVERVVMSMGGPDHWSEGLVGPPSVANPWVSAVIARFDTTGGTHYAAWKNGSAAQGSRIVLSRGTAASSYTTVATGNDGSGAANSATALLRLEVNGTTIRVWHFYSSVWNLAIDTTDATYSTGNYVGISGYRTTGASSVDDFQAGTGFLS
jgi:hypothetical protein